MYGDNPFQRKETWLYVVASKVSIQGWCQESPDLIMEWEEDPKTVPYENITAHPSEELGKALGRRILRVQEKMRMAKVKKVKVC